MRIWKASPLVVLMMAILGIVGLIVISAASLKPSDIPPSQLATTPLPGTATSQSTANPTQGLPTATVHVTMSPTVFQPDETPHPTAEVIILPSVVAEETFVPLGPTPDPTEQAVAELYHFLIGKLYEEEATPVAQGNNATPIPDPVYPNLALTTYSVQKVTLPQQATWDTWVPRVQGGGLELRSVTFNEAWRVTVKGAGFMVGGSIWMMYVDNQLLGRCAFANGGLTTIVYDRSLLTEGARLGISFGANVVTYLPEQIHLPTPSSK